MALLFYCGVTTVSFKMRALLEIIYQSYTKNLPEKNFFKRLS
jgi:hypothetical protein